MKSKLLEIDENFIFNELKKTNEPIYENFLLKKCFPKRYNKIFDDNMKMYQYHFSLFNSIYK